MEKAEEPGEATSADNTPEKLWEHPDPESTKMWKFLQVVNEKYNLNLKTYKELHGWSEDNTANFWEEVLQFVNVTRSRAHIKVSI